MAVIYQAQLVPSKKELLSAWVPAQPWFAAVDGLGTLDAVGAYRFDDPEGEVGVETHLLQDIGGPVFHVPLTYRGAPLRGAEASLIATVQHSVLGERWVYDACGDPVYAQALATAILTGGSQAEVEIVTGQGRERREPTAKVAGSGLPGSAVPPVGPVTHWSEGTSTFVKTGDFELTVLRVVDGTAATSATTGNLCPVAENDAGFPYSTLPDGNRAKVPGGSTSMPGVGLLVGTWPGHDAPALMATVRSI